MMLEKRTHFKLKKEKRNSENQKIIMKKKKKKDGKLTQGVCMN